METGLVTQSRSLASPPRGQTASSFGDRRAEYLLVIYPYGDLRDRLLEEQQQFSAGYDVTVRNRPHITMAVFQAAEDMEDTLIRWIQRICHRYQRFELTLNNYSGIPPHTAKPAEPPGSFKEQGLSSGEATALTAGQTLAVCRDSLNSTQRIPGTIYLRVQDPQPFRRLMQQLRVIDHYIRSSGCPPINLIDRPFLSIAGGLTEQVYNRAMPDYSQKTFHESFPVEELVLLKRNHHFDPCRTVNIFRLQPSSTGGAPAGTLPHL